MSGLFETKLNNKLGEEGKFSKKRRALVGGDKAQCGYQDIRIRKS